MMRCCYCYCYCYYYWLAVLRFFVSGVLAPTGIHDMISLDDVDDDDDAPPLLSSVQLWLQGNKELQWKQQHKACVQILGFRVVVIMEKVCCLFKFFLLLIILLEPNPSLPCNGSLWMLMMSLNLMMMLLHCEAVFSCGCKTIMSFSGNNNMHNTCVQTLRFRV
jgi:hypothetical protein